MFAPVQTGRTREHEPPELTCGFLHCYYKDIYGIRSVERELQNTVVWLSCGFGRLPSRDAVDFFLTDLEHVVDEVFDHLVEQAARLGLLNLTYCIDSTDVRAMLADQDASKCYAQPTTSATTAVRSSRPGKRSRLRRSSQRVSKRQRRRRCASRVTRSPSPSRSGWSVTAPTTRSTGTTTCWPQGSCQSPRTTRETPTTRKTSSTGSKTASNNTARTFS